jgi:hypothetical protein
LDFGTETLRIERDRAPAGLVKRLKQEWESGMRDLAG